MLLNNWQPLTKKPMRSLKREKNTGTNNENIFATKTDNEMQSTQWWRFLSLCGFFVAFKNCITIFGLEIYLEKLVIWIIYLPLKQSTRRYVWYFDVFFFLSLSYGEMWIASTYVHFAVWIAFVFVSQSHTMIFAMTFSLLCLASRRISIRRIRRKRGIFSLEFRHFPVI